MSNAVTFWNSKGDAILHIVGDQDVTSEQLLEMFDHDEVRTIIKRTTGHGVDNTSEETLLITEEL